MKKYKHSLKRDTIALPKKRKYDKSKRKRMYADKEIIKAMKNAGGFLTEVARTLKISYHTLWHRVTKSPKLKRKLDAIQESYLDLGESKLIESVQEGVLPAVFYYLKYKGKKRGYGIERQEVSGIDGQPLTQKPILTKAALSKLSVEDLRALTGILNKSKDEKLQTKNVN